MSQNQTQHQVWITGIGLLSSLGEGPDAHWQAMNAGKPGNLETEKFAPYCVHALGEVDWASQISRRDMRQMEPWQQIGTYAAGLALDDAGVKDHEDLCAKMDMIVAAGGGERDVATDSAILSEARGMQDTDALLAERLSNDLRPTLFLAQLSNLLAGNISIVHKVTGSSRTFMGEEGAGISAIQTAFARIASGQSDIMLVGGAFNGEREDMLLSFELGQYLLQGDYQTVWERAQSGGGLCMGSIGAFLVLESAEHARARDAQAYAAIEGIASDHGKREPGAASLRLSKMFNKLAPKQNSPVLSGATGVSSITNEEQDFLSEKSPNAPVRAFGSLFGHGQEAQFPLGVALAALAIKNNAFCPPIDSKEKTSKDSFEQVLVTTLGHWRSEGLGLISRADN